MVLTNSGKNMKMVPVTAKSVTGFSSSEKQRRMSAHQQVLALFLRPYLSYSYGGLNRASFGKAGRRCSGTANPAQSATKSFSSAKWRFPLIINNGETTMTTETNIPSITINETELNPIEFENQRVVTFAMIDKVHGRKTGTAQRNFIANKERLIEKDDYYLIDFAQNNVFRCFGIQIPPRGLTVLTESGYLLLVKSFTDDLAWQVQRQLVRTYFKSKPETVVLPDPQTLTPSQQHQLTKAVKAKAGNNPKALPEIWGRIKNKYKVAKYDQLPASQLQEVMDYVDSMKLATNQPQQQSLEEALLRIKIDHLEMTVENLKESRDMYKALVHDLVAMMGGKSRTAMAS